MMILDSGLLFLGHPVYTLPCTTSRLLFIPQWCRPTQWRRNEFESGGGAPVRRKAPQTFFCSYHSTFWL